MLRGTTAEEHLNILLGLENHLGKALAPTRSLRWAGRPTKTYYVSPGGFLHRKDPPGSDEGEGYFSGYLDDEFWHHLNNYLRNGGA